VFVRLEGETLADVSFQCECCGISMASASIMTDWLRGRGVREALALQERFLAALHSHEETLGPDAPPDHEAVLRVVRATPAREGCASMAWRALAAALGTV
jgi:nitrogen fixation NifU-like protein